MNASHSQRLWRLSGLLALDIIIFGGTNAAEAPSFVLIIGFSLLMLTLHQLIGGLVGVARWYGIKVKRKKSLTLYLTLIVSGLVALQSIGQLSQRDLLVLLPLAAGAYLYGAYARGLSRDL